MIPAAAQPAAPARDAPLPAIREDLQIMRGGVSYSGAPTWVIFDPVRNRFFRITYEMFQLLSLWNVSRTVMTLIAAIDRRFGHPVTPDEVGGAVRMLEHNLLLEQPATGDWRSLHKKAQPHHGWFMRIIHGYLFFKIPLLRPEGFIHATWPHVAFLFSRGFARFTLITGLIGLYLVLRQWEAFLGTFPFVFSLEGIIVSGLSIVFIKCLHELGHAYVAHKLGCRIPTMGVAFMVMMPLLYTDVSDAWRLKSRRDRLKIDAAGIMVEMAVAAFALFLWAFLPDGPMRSAVFVLAAVGWVMSLVVNLNPFMRFDGYYMFADLIGVENLQPRSFRHMRWRLRELLFGVGHAPPENFPPRLDWLLTAYAVATAIYRLMLYLGIALLVYHFTIKLLGILLFAVEIGFFIIRPVWGELKEWWSMRADILASRRTYVSAAVVAGAVLLAFLPLSTTVSAPAMLMPRELVRLYPQEPGRISEIAVTRGQQVAAGDPLFTIVSPAVTQQLAITEVELELAERRLARIGANPEELQSRLVLQSELGGLVASRAGLSERQGKLVVRSPFDGRVTDINAEISVGQWVARGEQLALVTSASGSLVRGFVAGEDSFRVEPGAEARFVPNDLTMPAFDTVLKSVGRSGVRDIDMPQLTSLHHGPIAVHHPLPGQRQQLAPVSAEYAVTAEVTGMPDMPGRSLQGVLLIDGAGQSLAARVWRQVLTVLMREAGF